MQESSTIPLHGAARHGHTRVIQTLLAAGSDVNHKTVVSEHDDAPPHFTIIVVFRRCGWLLSVRLVVVLSHRCLLLVAVPMELATPTTSSVLLPPSLH